MALEPFAIGVCSWSLQVSSVPELQRLLGQLGVNVVQIACGDPHHASWVEGDDLPRAALAAGFQLTGAMLGFPGEDYTTPQTIQQTGGFGDPATRPERLDRLRWALERTRALGLSDLTLHAGFLPEPGDPSRKPFLDTLAQAADLAQAQGVTLAFETGQETADLLRRTLDDLCCPNLKVNFDPANMLLYDKGDPIRAVELLGPDIRSVHVKDARRPKTPGVWGEEVPLGQGEVDIPRWLQALKTVGYLGPLCIEREVGDQAGRLADIAHGIRFLRQQASGEWRVASGE
jgi:sugar phosphate isomerase/epimerase